MKKVIIILLFSIVAGQLLAQGQAPKPDKNTIRRVMDWVSIFTMYSDVELTDRVDLKEYGEVADLIGAIVTNPELSVKIAEFKAATFVNVYPKGLTNTNEWIFNKLNDVSNAQYDALNAPYIILEVVFTPINQNTAYMVSVILKGSIEITQNLQSITSQINSGLSGKTFAKPHEAKETVNNAIFNGLAQLQTLLGNAYVPNIAIRYDDDLFMNNNTIETWQRIGESIELEAVDKNGIPISESIIWTNAQQVSGSKATYALDVAGKNTVTVKAGANQMSLLVNVKEFEVNVQEIIERLVREILVQLIDENQKQKQAAEADQAESERLIGEKALRIQQLRQDQIGSRTETVSPITARVSMVGGFYEEEPDQSLLEHPDYGEYIRKYQSREVLLKTLLFLFDQREVIGELLKPESIPNLAKEIENDIAKIASAVIVNLIRSDEAEMKKFLTDYLKNKVSELAKSK